MVDLNEIPDAVRAGRRKLGYSQTELASYAGVSRSFIDRLERGVIDNAGLANVLRVLDMLDLRLTVAEQEAPVPVCFADEADEADEGPRP